MTSLHVAFWNLENLFDVEHASARPEWLQKRLAKELEGWDDAVLDRKIAQLKKVIQSMNQGVGPDVLGVCEVENEAVLQKLVDALELPDRTYKVAHDDTSDSRGIDVAFIYDSEIFEAREQFSHVILKRNATRDLFQVTLLHHSADKELVVIGNHWPSRRGGKEASAPYRMMAGETLAYWHERIHEIKGENVAVMAMGDFNDEPFDSALVDYALSTYQQVRVDNARTPRFYNLMWELHGQRKATHYFGSEANVLDQMLVSKGLLNGDSGFAIKQGTIEIVEFPEMVSGGAYPGPVRYGRPSSGYNRDGFSDHYPISVQLEVIS